MKLLYSQIENFHKNTKYLSNYNTFWVLQNSDPIIQSFNIKRRATSIPTYDFSTLCTELPHDKLNSKLSSSDDFVYKGWDKTFIRLSHNGAVNWGKNKRGTWF